MVYTPYQGYYTPQMHQNINNDRLAYLQQYQQQMPQPQQPQQMQQGQQTFNQGLLWVQGEAGAKSYMVAPGASVLLMDSEGPRFYIKTVDNSGIPTMRIFEYKELAQNQVPPVVAEAKEPEYATHDEIDQLKREIQDLKKKLEVKHEPTIQPTKRRTKSDAESDEDDK